MPSKQSRTTAIRTELADHRWVAAALLELGYGGTNPRAERASRTGRHVVPPGTRIDVLEVYCAKCRIPYESRNDGEPCSQRFAARAG